MKAKKKIVGICGSASQNSGNRAILNFIAEHGNSDLDLEIIDNLYELPHFRTELTETTVPNKIIEFRNKISNADGIIICTPEYIFSIPSGLKNAIEWCVSTTVFSDKPIGIIVASANGEKGLEELKLIMKTIQTIFTDETTLLIRGIRGKISRSGKITHEITEKKLKEFIQSLIELVKKTAGQPK